MKYLIQNGVIVTPANTFKADVLVGDGVIQAIGARLSEKGDDVQGYRRLREVSSSRGDRRTYPYGPALRRHGLFRRFCGWNGGRGVWGGYHDNRFCHSGKRGEPGPDRVEAEGPSGRHGLYRLRPPRLDHRFYPCSPGRNGRHHQGRLPDVQAVHGLSGLGGRRLYPAQCDQEGEQEQRHDRRPCGKPEPSSPAT